MMSRENPTPVYYQVQLALKKQIEEGHWLPGEKIPTEKKLADLYSLSTGTIRQAIMNLVNEGYLYRVAGKGSFVQGTVLRRKNLRYYRMLSHFQDDDEANLTIKFLSLKKIDPGQDQIRCLNLRQNQKIYKLSRLFYCNNRPTIHSISYLPCNMFNRLEKIPFAAFENAPIYTVLEDHYGITTVHNKELFSSTTSDSKNAKILDTEIGSSLLLIEMLSYTYREKIYEYRKSFCLTEKQKILMEI